MTDSIIAILDDCRCDDGDICTHDLPEGFELVDEGEWTQEHKYQSAEQIVKHTLTGRHFCLSRSRCGSYHTDWYYSRTLITEVVKVEKTIVVTVWEPK